MSSISHDIIQQLSIYSIHGNAHEFNMHFPLITTVSERNLKFKINKIKAGMQRKITELPLAVWNVHAQC